MFTLYVHVCKSISTTVSSFYMSVYNRIDFDFDFDLDFDSDFDSDFDFHIILMTARTDTQLTIVCILERMSKEMDPMMLRDGGYI